MLAFDLVIFRQITRPASGSWDIKSSTEGNCSEGPGSFVSADMISHR